MRTVINNTSLSNMARKPLRLGAQLSRYPPVERLFSLIEGTNHTFSPTVAVHSSTRAAHRHFHHDHRPHQLAAR
jgi:hypothetical protein